MTDDRLYTLRQISQELDLPESTVRYYRDSFSQYLPTVGTGRRRRYPEKGLAVLRIVADAYAQNRSREEIEAYLDSVQTERIEPEPVVGFDSRERTREDSDESIGQYIEGERDRRDALWHMAREIVRLGEAIDRQGVMLGELAKQLADQSNRTLPTPPADVAPTPPEVAQTPVAPEPAPDPEVLAVKQPPTPDAAPRVAAQMAAQHQPVDPVPTPAVPDDAPAVPAQPAPQTSVASTPVADAADAVPIGDLDDVAAQLATLREQLARERDLVERLRKSKMDVERRAAEAESKLGYGSEPPIPRTSRKSMFTRFFNQG